jgi:transcriptional regulator with XRE-family HTH domain
VEVLSERIKKERKRKGISQKMLSTRLNISQSNVSEWERGDSRPTIENLIKIADILGVTVDYLIGRTDNPLSLIKNDTPYIDVNQFEKELLETFRTLSTEQKIIVCRSIGIEHPAERWDKAKKTSIR